MHKSLKLDPNKCTGCLQCEMACAYRHHKTFNTAKSRIKVFGFEREGRKVPYTCTQCDEAWCLHACPVQAIARDPRTGAKVVLEDLCVGCKVCTIACPFGTVNYLAGAAACPTGAIAYLDADWTGLGRMRQWAEKTDTNPATV